MVHLKSSIAVSVIDIAGHVLHYYRCGIKEFQAISKIYLPCLLFDTECLITYGFPLDEIYHQPEPKKWCQYTSLMHLWQFKPFYVTFGSNLTVFW